MGVRSGTWSDVGQAGESMVKVFVGKMGEEGVDWWSWSV